MEPFKFTLYISGRARRSQQAIAVLEQICKEQMQVECETEVIDVLTNPEAAHQDRIVTTPVIIKRSPPPSRRMVGDLTDLQQVMTHLDLLPYGKEKQSAEQSDNAS